MKNILIAGAITAVAVGTIFLFYMMIPIFLVMGVALVAFIIFSLLSADDSEVNFDETDITKSNERDS